MLHSKKIAKVLQRDIDGEQKETKIPRSFTEAMKTPQKDEWYAGIENEVNAMFLKEYWFRLMKQKPQRN
ncbi:hypothetical protein DD237_008061 [Peronospora effusa]|uniref:Uncharacterized protein n=1 Tax=Peronospora effusa TaxID=542832 RepID=A0A3R7W8S8_9STRA|nr:hypothetical protein DD237_008061 [Peronospora effusa]